MSTLYLEEKRVLALDPTSKGLGFAVLEGPDRLVDWGLKHVRGDLNGKSLAQASDLIRQYQPNLLVIEDARAQGCRRRQRVRRLLARLAPLARRHRVRCRAIPQRWVLACFALEATNKQRIAVAIAERFPELDPRLPPLRNPFMGEDERTAIFDATALALTFFAASNSHGH